MKNVYSASGLLLLAVLFLALTILSASALRGLRIDLTDQGLYTLSAGTVNLLENLDSTVKLDFYFSEEASAELPMVRNFARRIEELLDEMSEHSGGQLRVQRIDPAPFTELEDRAARYGLEGVPVSAAGDNLYLGMVGTNMIDGVEVLPFLSPGREAFLEYDLARMVYLLSRPDRPRVALLDGIGMGGGFDMQTGQQREPWVIHDQLHELFDVEPISTAASDLPDEIDVLVLVHPQQLSADLMLEIEDFLAGGGRLLAFVDPHAESARADNPNDPMAALSLDRRSGLDELFAAWGLEFSDTRFVADAGLALQVSTQQGQRPVRHAGILGVTREQLDSEDVVTGDLTAVNLASVGHLALAEASPLTLETLMHSSDQAGLIDSERLQFMTDPAGLLAELAITGDHYTLAARLSGEVPRRLSESASGESYSLDAIVVADVDLLADQYWVQRQRFFGTTLVDPFAGNGDFVANAIDNLIGNADLISVRSRAISNRPFTMVDSLRREAEENLRATEQRLEAELAETERRLGELQQARGDTDLAILTADQEAELDRFMDQRLEIRQQLRQVRRELDEDIQSLGTRVKAVNIVLMPTIVTLLALGLAWHRRRSRQGRADQGAQA